MKFLLIALLFSTLSVTGAKAQYEEFLKPQPEDEIETYRKAGVKKETIYVEREGQQLPVSDRYFDRKGHLTRLASYSRRMYYTYDGQGRVVSHVDSTLNEEVFEVSTYHFEYGPEGKLSKMSFPNGYSTFTWDPEQRKLREERMEDGIKQTVIYSYMKDGKLMEARYYNVAEELVRREIWSYTTTGLLYNYTDALALKDATDSMVTFYQYNAQKKVATKMLNTWRKWYVSKVGDKPTHEAEFYDVATNKYTYNDAGRMTSDEFDVKKNKTRNYFKKWNYDENGLITDGFAEPSVGETAFLKYEYTFY